MALTKVSRGLLSTGIVDNSTTTAITIDSSENVGIGTDSPSYKADILATNQLALRLNTTDADGCFLAIQTNGTAKGYLGTSHHLATGTPSENDITLRAENNLQFTTGGSSERMRIDSSGNLMVGGTAAGTVSGNNAMITVRRDSGNCGISYQSGTAATDQWETYSTLGAQFYIENTSTSNGAYLQYNSGSGWTNISDERWKTNWASLDDASSKIAALNVGKYHMLNNSKETIEAAKWDYGVKAQELLEVIPDAVDVPENPEDKYGVVSNIVFWHAVKAIQEQQATIEALTQRIQTLENN